ncbi:alpha/beta hydrolase [Desmospora profundinema]|uniref:Enterochelin esterase-like enzyme n=1 Tax=Desmospora profundinema TaxID=1571184 RepID=A0ABU1IPE7_9BACL|nr:alpha/beta hydrolase-fold protein [Desmospora profundinema]MDR6226029.1 enterochelin esterase-like enzyme [Desmospora profundinema]
MDQRYLKRTIVNGEVESSHLGETRSIQVYLPPEHDDHASYPVLYLQDGDDYLNLGRLATQANRLILDGEIRPFAAVAIPVDKEKRTSEYAPVGERHQPYLRFFTDELLPYVEGEFPVAAIPGERVLGGSSLGGTVSLHLALQNPQQFHRILSQSGAFLEPTLEAIRHTDSLSHLEIYQTIGKAETAVPTHIGNLDLLSRNREVHRALQEKDARIHYTEQDGNHTWGFWQKDLPQALAFFFGM